MPDTEIDQMHVDSADVQRPPKACATDLPQLASDAIDSMQLTHGPASIGEILVATAGSCPREETGEERVEAMRDSTFTRRQRSDGTGLGP